MISLSHHPGMIVCLRVTITPIRPKDWPAYQVLYSNPALWRYDEQPPDIAEAFSQSLGNWFDQAGWNEYGVRLGETLIGVVSHAPMGKFTRVGYHFDPVYHGNGYASEAVTALVREIHQRGMPLVECTVDRNNLPSVRLLTRLGFTQASRTWDLPACDDRYLATGLLEQGNPGTETIPLLDPNPATSFL